MSNFNTGTLIRQLREQYGYSLQDVAKLIGVSKPAITQWEAGGDIRIENLYSLARLFNVTFSELYQGKLNNESFSEYWKRNYDLDNFRIDEDIIENDITQVKVMFEHINMVKEAFIELLPKWARNELTKEECEKFELIRKYYELDYNYCLYYKNDDGFRIFHLNEEREKEYILDVLEKISSFDDENAKLWELNKLYNFSYDYNEKAIQESRSLKALEYMLSSFSQIEKDLLLFTNYHIKEKIEKETSDGFGPTKYTQNIERDRTEDEIENIPYFKIMINSGAHCIYRKKYGNNGWDDEQFEFAEGKKVLVDNSLDSKYQYYNAAGFPLRPILDYWKAYSYEQYLELIDYDETERLSDIVNLKDSHPLEFYNKMVERGYK